MSDRRVRWLTVAAFAALGLYSLSRLELTNSITHLIPSRSEAELIELTLELVESPLARRMLLSVSGGPECVDAAAELAEALRVHPEVAWVESGIDEGTYRSIYELYFDRRVFFASDAPETELREMLEPEALERSALRLRGRLGQPGSILVSRTAPADPLGLFEGVIDRIRSARPGVARGEHAILMLGLRSSPFESAAQSVLLRDIEAEFARIDAARGGRLVLEQSGVNRFAVASEQSVRGDVRFISTVSITVVCSLFLLFFRSLRYLLIAILTPIGGFVAALAVALSSSEPVHGITLAFGFVLIGVAIDYPIHLMNHHALAPGAGPPRQSVVPIRPSLVLSALTTTLAFSVLGLSDFPGLSEMGAFAAIGVPVALALTLFSTPAFLRPAPPTPTQLALSRAAVRVVHWLEGHRGCVMAIFAIFAATAAVGLPGLRWEDDPDTLMAIDPLLLDESERVRGRAADYDGGRFVVGLGPAPEAALALNDLVYRRLAEVVSSGELEGVGSLHAFLWSQALQRENLAVLRAVPDLGDRLDRAFSRNGFRPGAFRTFAAAVASPAAAPLRPEDLARSPLARTLDSLVELEGRWAVVTYLRGVGSGAAVEAAIADLEGVHYVDQGEIVADVYEGYRRSTVRMVVLGSVIVFLVLTARYRDLSRGLLAILPSTLAALTTLGLFGLLGEPVNVASAISLLVILGMGVDYGVFAVDGAGEPARHGATLSSLLISCLTTLFVFGILALSSQPVLRAIGLTTGTGMLLAFALSPLALVLARQEPAEGRSPG